MKKGKSLLIGLLVCLLFFAGCAAKDEPLSSTEQSNDESSGVETALDKIDMTKWNYDEEHDVYWQVGVAYCENPADAAYENLGIYVPGAYMEATANGDGTYTCQIDTTAEINGFTALSAPIVIPVDTPGYAAMAAPVGYVSSTSSYTDAGFIYVYAGCRGRDAGAPAGVTDLKAAIRYIRYNEGTVPGNTDRIFSFGMSGGGAQSALLGATGDSDLYEPYLAAIGAVQGISDAIAGSMCWCPITNLDYAGEAYEWNLGVSREGLSEEMQQLSDAMAEQFALYINELKLRDSEGNSLLLTVSEEGIYQAGSYYDYLKNVIETSLNNFLADSEFPLTVSSSGKGGFDLGFDLEERDFGDFADGKEGFGGFDEDDEKGGFGGKGDKEDTGFLDRNEGETEYRDGIVRNEVSQGITVSGTYQTAQDYIDALNAETTWVIYDSETGSASITSVADFVCALKNASKDLGAFDAPDESQGENILFGDGDGLGDHFDAVMAKLLEGSEYGDEYAADLTRTDALGTTVADRVNMYNPLYYLCEYYEGYGSANVAAFWRIRSGINQSDTALTTEVNLALALENYGADVDFETVWNQAHTEAERSGNSTSNFIAWVIACTAQMES